MVLLLRDNNVLVIADELGEEAEESKDAEEDSTEPFSLPFENL